MIGMMGKTPEADALQKALTADPGAAKAAAKWMAEMFPHGERDDDEASPPPTERGSL